MHVSVDYALIHSIQRWMSSDSRNPVSSDRPSTLAVSTPVRQKHGIAFHQEKLGISGHAFSIIPNTVQQQDGISVVRRRLCIPGAKNYSIARGDIYVFEVSPEARFIFPMNLVLMPHRAARGTCKVNSARKILAATEPRRDAIAQTLAILVSLRFMTLVDIDDQPRRSFHPTHTEHTYSPVILFLLP